MASECYLYIKALLLLTNDTINVSSFILSNSKHLKAENTKNTKVMRKENGTEVNKMLSSKQETS